MDTFSWLAFLFYSCLLLWQELLSIHQIY
ncbi:hypothetical protein, partial [Neobacillus drentensis]